jgi:hypothetical protein
VEWEAGESVRFTIVERDLGPFEGFLALITPILRHSNTPILQYSNAPPSCNS